MIIHVKDAICSQCTSYEKGNALYDMIILGFSADNITIDMDGVILSSSAFYNASIAKLVLNFGLSVISSKITFKNLSPGDNYQLINSINLAKKLQKEVT